MRDTLTLRPFQAEALRALQTPGHLICVAPTGSGKSLIFERYASWPGTRTLLLTPLVALARQHSDRLRVLGIPVALAAGGAHEPPPSDRGVWVNSPEALLLGVQKRGISLLRLWRPTLLVVDECHSLWEWGERFRPCLNRIPDLLRDPGIPRSLWLTATLPEPARNALRASLPEPVREIGEFSLPETLRITVSRVPPEARADAVMSTLRALLPRPGILFTPTRSLADRWAARLRGAGIRAIAYHAGMSREERASAERIVRTGWVQAVCATSAFGMGMDFSHLEWMISSHAPPTLLTLAQAAGRVGRNGRAGQAFIFWDPTDFRIFERDTNTQRQHREMTLALEALGSGSAATRALNNYFGHTSSADPSGIH
ncbi:MAG: ATP-dependent DNA helicase RecQ [Bdellovibrionales bacterium]|nr:ATP-dependent DNA helicase RecQ [Bdellovibrionales bacterium]